MRKILSVDFDGLLCRNEWPEIGHPRLDAIAYVMDKKDQGWIIILNTCRTGRMLTPAIEWAATQGIVFDYVNENAKEAIEAFGGDCRKVFAHEYLDDRNVVLDKPNNTFERRVDENYQIIYEVIRGHGCENERS